MCEILLKIIMIQQINEIAKKLGWKPFPSPKREKGNLNNFPLKKNNETIPDYKIRLIHYFRDDCNLRIDFAFKRAIKIIKNIK